MRIRIDLPPDLEKRLIESAIGELRPVSLQVEVLLRRALGLGLPGDGEATEETNSKSEPDAE